MTMMIDCTGLSAPQITALKSKGVSIVGRYLSHSSWKGLTLGEIANLKAAGIDIFSIYETNPTSANYFKVGKGKSDALDAVGLANSLGQPANTCICFTVDYDAQSADLNAILTYFQEVKANLSGFKVGAYGSFTVLNFLKQHNAADYYFQTVAWSAGQRCSFANMYQAKDDVLNWEQTGIDLDTDEVLTGDIGTWNQATKPVVAPINDVKPAPQVPTTPTNEWVIFQLTNPVYGLYSVPLTTWKCDSHSYGGWYFVSKEIMKDSQGNIWHHLYIGDTDYGWASQPLLTAVNYKWGTINVDTTGYLHATFDSICGTIAKGTKVAVIQDQADKCLVVSDNQPQWVMKNIVTE